MSELTHPPRPTPELALALAAEIESGKSYRAACQVMGLSHTTVHRWRFQFPDDFGALIAAALATRGPGPTGRPSTYDPDLAERILDDAARGKALHEICADPDMPTERTVMNWLRQYADFREGWDIAKDVQAERLKSEALAVARTSTKATAATDRQLLATLRWQVGTRAPSPRRASEPRQTVTLQVVRVVDAPEASQPALTAPGTLVKNTGDS